MAILHVAQLGHPVLRLVADPVDPALISTPEFQGFLEDMLETMDEYDGVGLAAPQVHTSIRVVALTLSPEKGPEIWINPEITPLGDETLRNIEGCLSIDGLRAAVDRCAHIQVRFLDREGEAKGYELKGFPAVVAQHECDHLDGVLFVDRCDTTTLAFLREFRRFGPLDQWEEGDERLPDDEEPAAAEPQG